MRTIQTPINELECEKFTVGERILLSGNIYCGRDAVLPKICEFIRSKKNLNDKINFQGAVIFHTAVSPAGVGPTSSNKLEIEESFATLTKAGVKIHLGKGKIKMETIKMLKEERSVYAVVPPVTALLGSRILNKEVLAFPELGMEAFYRIEVINFPMIIAVADGMSIYT